MEKLNNHSVVMDGCTNVHPSMSLSELTDELVINEALPNLIHTESTALILDINNLYLRAKDNNFRIDYGNLYSIFSSRCNLSHAGAFSAIDRSDSSSLDWVDYMTKKGYHVVTKDLKRYTSVKEEVMTTVVKGNMDVELTIHALTKCNDYNHLILGSCDGDFTKLITTLKENTSKKISVLGISNFNSSGMSESLIREADNFYDLRKLIPFISYKKD